MSKYQEKAFLAPELLNADIPTLSTVRVRRCRCLRVRAGGPHVRTGAPCLPPPASPRLPRSSRLHRPPQLLSEAVRTPDTQATLRTLAAAGDVRGLVNTPATTDGLDPTTTPLMLAALAGQLAQVELLLQNGANPGTRNQKQMTAGQLASEVREARARRPAAVD